MDYRGQEWKQDQLGGAAIVWGRNEAGLDKGDASIVSEKFGE